MEEINKQLSVLQITFKMSSANVAIAFKHSSIYFFHSVLVFLCTQLYQYRVSSITKQNVLGNERECYKSSLK